MDKLWILENTTFLVSSATHPNGYKPSSAATQGERVRKNDGFSFLRKYQEPVFIGWPLHIRDYSKLQIFILIHPYATQGSRHKHNLITTAVILLVYHFTTRGKSALRRGVSSHWLPQPKNTLCVCLSTSLTPRGGRRLRGSHLCSDTSRNSFPHTAMRHLRAEARCVVSECPAQGQGCLHLPLPGISRSLPLGRSDPPPWGSGVTASRHGF